MRFMKTLYEVDQVSARTARSFDSLQRYNRESGKETYFPIKPERSRHCISEQPCMEPLSPSLRDFSREGAGARGTGARRTA